MNFYPVELLFPVELSGDEVKLILKALLNSLFETEDGSDEELDTASLVDQFEEMLYPD